MSADYDKGFIAGYKAGLVNELGASATEEWPIDRWNAPGQRLVIPKKIKRKQTGKAKILTDMTRPIWNKYKKGSGKKTYFDIRSQVQRSMKYRKKTKGM